MQQEQKGSKNKFSLLMDQMDSFPLRDGSLRSKYLSDAILHWTFIFCAELFVWHFHVN